MTPSMAPLLFLLAGAALLSAEPAKRPVAWPDLPPALRETVAAERAFDGFLAAVNRATGERVLAGEGEHLVYYLLQSNRFTRRPRIEPALSAREFVSGLEAGLRARYLAGADPPRVVPPKNVAARIQDFRRGKGDERLEYFRGLLGRIHAPVETLYARAMRFLYLKEFEKRDGVLYQRRGHSSDTQPEAGFTVWTALQVLKALEPAARLPRVLLVGPGMDYAPRTALDDALPPQSYQPFALADALLSLGLASPENLQVQCADVNPRVVEFLAGFTRRSAPALTLFRKTDDPDYAAYFQRLGERIGGAEGADPRTIRIRPELARRIVANRLNVITERYTPSPDFDLAVATNVLVYFNNAELALALANIHSMLRPGGYLIHNEPRLETETFGKMLALAPVQARSVRIAGNFDVFVIHRKQ